MSRVLPAGWKLKERKLVRQKLACVGNLNQGRCASLEDRLRTLNGTIIMKCVIYCYVLIRQVVFRCNTTDFSLHS
jgi:hypothetical protein